MRLRRPASAPSRCFADVLAGRYRLDGLIGSGGAADVHRGLDLRLRRAVAVKVFRAGADADMEERFHNEAVILARLRHPGLVTVYDAGRHDGRPYLVMELIDGPTLKRRIAEGPLSPGVTAALGAGLARALAHAHEAGIVHRDVKPSNILLDSSGRPHLTDFGISRLVDATTRTAPGALIGTAAYLAPEQVLGRPVGPAADVHALGLVLLECLTARLEYGGVPLEAAIARLHRRPVLPGFIPHELAELLRKMTALDERDRPSAHGCAQVLSTLARSPGRAAEAWQAEAEAQQGQPEATEPRLTLPGPSAAPRGVVRGAPARRRVLVAGGAAALVTALATTLAVPDGSSDAKGRATTPRSVTAPPSATKDGESERPAAPPSSGPTSRERLGDTALQDSPQPAPPRPTREAAGAPAGHGGATGVPPRSGRGGTPKKAKEKAQRMPGGKGRH
ncbi:serine/threonine protein kinase [Streptomyces sp. Ru71]|uniref:serine/threonine-protein kinase n=1 Tax=Streptomyces sp. Ru71 TaxID=2080746 RepID=UPI000CDD9A33|nr:serine/threonine-protein kinase [Streptomyces sp. Ru71]POX53100.1 serine/threonine protein kinase [Streptomyces sp. Ru71]